VRVFGCEGPTDVTVDRSIGPSTTTWTSSHVSLGVRLERRASAVASTNAARPGSSSLPRRQQRPKLLRHRLAASADGPSRGGERSLAALPGANITAGIFTVPAIDATLSLSGTTNYTIKVLTGANVLGCSVDAFGGLNSLRRAPSVLVNRGTCARRKHLRSEGRCGRSGDGEQRDQLPAVEDRLPRTRTPAKLST